ncbi:hypothetical protein CRE_20853 [Caenorhabditis remanei]|uniref:Uncharacterized protein n=1 Tax=Caenorhabditis remanei TaxID=31234 RepID=E3MV58_CAERE|nr:hypothetical protein CRE_20853 [Caenorhabditis remanei]
MAAHRLVELLVCLALVTPSMAVYPSQNPRLTCHFYSMFVNDFDRTENNRVCTAYFHVPTKTFKFEGTWRDPKKISPSYNFTSGQDCQIKMVDGEEIYECFCFTPLCNTPYSVDDFVARGYTLRPTYTRSSSSN